MSVTELIHFDKDGHIENRSLWKTLFLALVIVLVALLSFGIGRLTAVEGSEGIKVEYDPELTGYRQPTTNNQGQTATVANSLTPPINNSGKAVIASKNGSKYHYSHCSGAKQIKEENKIAFVSAQEAEASGYTLAANCQPQ